MQYSHNSHKVVSLKMGCTILPPYLHENLQNVQFMPSFLPSSLRFQLLQFQSELQFPFMSLFFQLFTSGNKCKGTVLSTVNFPFIMGRNQQRQKEGSYTESLILVGNVMPKQELFKLTKLYLQRLQQMFRASVSIAFISRA